ncbi:MAG: hypothetical protein FJX48_13065 [Alphaproteobacteria bacterium]|nr:hypothetical protein [Alphaproteobacteria bacterium]
MKKLKVKEISEGLHRSEVIVSVHTTGGDEGLVLDRRSLQNGYIAVGYPIRVDGDSYLVELPRETSSGSWRVWVDGSQLDAAPEKEVA